MRTPATVFLLIFLPTSAFSQQALVERGIAEFYLSTFGGAAPGALLYGGELGVGLDGVVGIGIQYAVTDIDEAHQSSNSVTAALTLAFHPSREGQESVIAIQLGWSTVDLSKRFGEGNNYLSLGLAGAGKNRLSSTVLFMPSAGMTLGIPLYKDDGYYSHNRPSTVIGIGAGAGFRFDLSPGSYAFIIPGFSIAKNVKAITLQAGIGLKSRFTPQPRREGR